MNSVFIFVLLIFSVLSTQAMESSKPSVFPTLKDFCYASALDWPRNSSNPIDISRLPQELGEELVEITQSEGSNGNVTEIIENNIARRAPDSFLLALCLRNKDNKLAQRLMMQILNKYPENLFKDFEESVAAHTLDENGLSSVPLDTDLYLYLNIFSKLMYYDTEESNPFSFNNDLFPDSWTCFSICLDCGNEAATRYLINKFRLNINNLRTLATPLQRASQTNNLILAKSVLDLGINVDNADITPLCFAASSGHCKMVTLLLNYGSTKGFDAIKYIIAANNFHEFNESRKKILQQLCKKISPQQAIDLLNMTNRNTKIDQECQTAFKEALNNRAK